jgi:DNA polymerase-3 subunit epsilon
MDVCVIDIETTGLDPIFDYIVEVGICKLDLATGEVSPLLNTLVCEEGFKWDGDPDGWIFNNSSLSYEDVLTAPAWEVVRPNIKEIIKKYPVTAFNKDFDLGFLYHRGVHPRNVLPCIMKTATPVCRIPHPSYPGYKWPKAEEAWDYFFPHHGYVELHRAYDDCVHEALILHEMYTRGHFLI